MMRKVQILAIPLLIVLVLLIGMGAGACGGGGEGEVAPPPGEEEEAAPTPALPKPGEWVASTGCSEFTFYLTVSPDGTSIPETSYSLFQLECGSYIHTAPHLTAEHSPPWPITGGQFTIDFVESFQTMSDWHIVIQGSFNETGTNSSGTWEISADGTTCQAGTWESSSGS